MTTNAHYPVIITGGGPAGLASAYWLKTAGISFAILEKSVVGASWKNHYDNLTLHTLKEVSVLPGRPMPAHYPAFVPKDQVAAYLDAYAQHFDFPIFENQKVVGIKDNGYRWDIQTESSRFTTEQLILTTGIWSNPFTPSFKEMARFKGEISHAASYKNSRPFAGERVLVVGGGNSATEIAVEVSRVADHTAILIRDGTSFVPYPKTARSVKIAAALFRVLPGGISHRLLASSRPDFSHIGIYPPPRPLTEVYPVVGFECPEAIERGEIELITTPIDRFEKDGVWFDNKTCKPFTRVIMATGYRPAVDFAASYFEYTKDGKLILDRQNRSTKHARLYAAGYDYPNTEGWFQSIPRVSKTTADAVIKALNPTSNLF